MDSQGRTALNIAVTAGKTDMVKVWVRKGVDVRGKQVCRGEWSRGQRGGGILRSGSKERVPGVGMGVVKTGRGLRRLEEDSGGKAGWCNGGGSLLGSLLADYAENEKRGKDRRSMRVGCVVLCVLGRWKGRRVCVAASKPVMAEVWGAEVCLKWAPTPVSQQCMAVPSAACWIGPSQLASYLPTYLPA
eukprot:36351-Chlamydomonas_euryale.AAC.3